MMLVFVDGVVEKRKRGRGGGTGFIDEGLGTRSG